MTDHFIEENGGRYIKHMADADGKMFTYYVLYDGKLVLREDEQE
jgi:hypothetical protein